METDTIDRLTDVLARSEKSYDELLGLLTIEKDAAIHSNAGKMAEAVEQKTEALALLAALEKQRRQLVQTIAAELHVPPNQLTLSRLALSLPAERSAHFKRLSVSLGGLASKVQRANEENRILVRHCLDLVGGALGFFQHLLNPVSVYSSGGRVHTGSGSGRLLSGNI